MKKIILIIGLFLLLILTQCNWYVQYQPYKTISYQDLSQVVKDSVKAVHTRAANGDIDESGCRTYPNLGLIAVDGKYLFATKYFTWSPGGSWVDYYYIINRENNKIYKIKYNIPNPCIIYKDSLYIPTDDNYNWFNYKEIDTSELKFKRYKL